MTPMGWIALAAVCFGLALCACAGGAVILVIEMVHGRDLSMGWYVCYTLGVSFGLIGHAAMREARDEDDGGGA